jgi:hypothetical protein
VRPALRFWIGVQQTMSLVQNNTRCPNMCQQNGMPTAKVQLAVFCTRCTPISVLPNLKHKRHPRHRQRTGSGILGSSRRHKHSHSQNSKLLKEKCITVHPFVGKHRISILLQFCQCGVEKALRVMTVSSINALNTKRRPLYLKTQFVPRSKHFSSRLLKPISL